MGLLTSLALLLTPLARRSLIPVRSRESELEARIETLERELSEARAERDSWESMSHRWQARYEQAINPILEEETRAQVRHQVMLHQAMAQYQQAQVSQAMALGAQQFDGRFCNCIPARHDMFLGGNPSGSAS